jgi:hypothetical protein
MGKMISLLVPKELLLPLFYTGNDEEVFVDSHQPDPLNPFFSYEILYYNKIVDTPVPWNTTSYIQEAEEGWQGIREELNAAFSSRSADEINSLMKKAIAQFLMYLFWTNQMPAKPAIWREELGKMRLKPVNADERLSFVLTQPSLFHSYKQLEQLFIEQLKQYLKQQAIKKINNKNSV